MSTNCPISTMIGSVRRISSSMSWLSTSAITITRRSPTHVQRSTTTPACLAPSADPASRDQVANRSCWLIAAPYSTWKSRWNSMGDLRVGASRITAERAT
jgi:hypothetical protein